ncbi:hypothetical protein NQ315_009789 [Exocentrus adspersus]|uniref:Thyroglobulin type-1 domain-containing protein n=1 Tax=Exocentrus adspersus TaxID=1586481 RepID=A0AAV8WH98_9CUCU|nr:hypothetical protein NQ315_009789 [Exocentrus adspersus]
MKMIFLYLLFSAIVLCVSAEESILCTASFCDEIECDDLPPKCQIQNSTHNGIFLPSPQICNCCQYCLENLDAGDRCSTGNPSDPSHTSICGPGLSCQPEEEGSSDGFCKRMNTACHLLQDDYDTRRLDGTLGSLETRQTCEDDGTFSSYKCIPGQTCYCVSKTGTRIFGESDFTGLPSFKMQCGCSRAYTQAVEIMGKQLGPSEFFRCSSSGDYDVIQCIGEHCMCVDAEDGAPTYPDQSLVNITLISNETLKCFSGEEGVFYKKCEEEYVAVLNEVRMYKQQGYDMVFSYTFPKCDIDGTYQPVQENSTHKMCFDKEGTVLVAVDKVENATLADAMDCKCLRAVLLMTSPETPTCAENGNYSPIQCRRGTCRCVDSNGNQVCNGPNCEVPEIDRDSLQC